MVEYHERPGRQPTLKPGTPSPLAEDKTPVEGASLSTVEQTLQVVQAVQQAQQQMMGQMGPGSPGGGDERLSDIEKAVKWASPWRQMVGIVVFLVATGIAAYAFLRDRAEAAVIDTVQEATGGENPKIEPSVKTVEKLKKDVGSVKTGVGELLKQQENEKLIKAVEVELELHNQQHQELLQEWSAKKAAGQRPGRKPTKSDGHLKLEAERQRLLKKE
jgi:hypothetical protein